MQVHSFYPRNPLTMVSNFIERIRQPEPLKITEKSAEVKSEIISIAVMPERNPASEKRGLWGTAEKVGSVIRTIAEPVAKKVVKGTVDLVLDKLEMRALEKVVDVLGDKVLPGEIAVVPTLIKMIRAGVLVLKAANQTNRTVLDV